MKTTLLLLLILIGQSVFGATSDLRLTERREACRAIAQLLDYDEGVSLSLCANGAWNVSDVEEGNGHRQVAFDWEGKISRFQGGNDRCSGYVHTYRASNGRRRIEVLDLSCH